MEALSLNRSYGPGRRVSVQTPPGPAVRRHGVLSTASAALAKGNSHPGGNVVTLLTRRRSREDERRVIVTLTAEGAAMRAQAGEILRCIFAAADMPAEAFAKLTHDIKALRRNLERAAKA